MVTERYKVLFEIFMYHAVQNTLTNQEGKKYLKVQFAVSHFLTH